MPPSQAASPLPMILTYFSGDRGTSLTLESTKWFGENLTLEYAATSALPSAESRGSSKSWAGMGCGWKGWEGWGRNCLRGRGCGEKGRSWRKRVLLLIQRVRGRRGLHLDRQPGIALENKGKVKAQRPQLLTGAGYCQEIKLPLLLQKKTTCESTDLSQSQTCA